MKRRQVWKLTVYRYKDYCRFSIQRNDVTIYFHKMEKSYNGLLIFELKSNRHYMGMIDLRKNKIVFEKSHDMMKED